MEIVVFLATVGLIALTIGLIALCQSLLKS
jgi:hypothetical protein